MLSRRDVLRSGVALGAITAVGGLAACGATAPTVGSSPSPGAALVPLADVPVGGAVAATTAAGDKILVCQPSAGTVVAFSAVCTHAGCIVQPGKGELDCPCHGSIYDAATGQVKQGPATRALPEVKVKVDGNQVVEA